MTHESLMAVRAGEARREARELLEYEAWERTEAGREATSQAMKDWKSGRKEANRGEV